jgi:hypothetical protein
MIVFENQGEIDLRSVSTFGVSVKETDNPIGFFGTGLKYAIAVLLRTSHKVTIQAGETVVRFGVERDAVRGQEFQFVTMQVGNAAPNAIGFTTELGKQWELWMAYRELACNCKDESGIGRYAKTMPRPESGTTRIIVEGQDFEAVFADGHLYILADEPQQTVGTTEIRFRRSGHLYYRGVRVMELPRSALYTYNLNTKLELTEDRTVRHQWEPMHRIAQCILQSEDDSYIRTCVTADDMTLEGGLDLHGWGYTPSKQFLATVGEALADRMCKVNPTAMRVWKESTKQTIAPREMALTKVQTQSMKRAVSFCEAMGYDVTSYEIKFVESLGDNTLGLADGGCIYIASRVFEMGGAKQLASTLIEEFLHLRRGWKDCTRELQNYLFEKVVSLGEELQGEPL